MCNRETSSVTKGKRNHVSAKDSISVVTAVVVAYSCYSLCSEEEGHPKKEEDTHQEEAEEDYNQPPINHFVQPTHWALEQRI